MPYICIVFLFQDNIMVATCTDRGIRLFDIRNPESIRKVCLQYFYCLWVCQSVL